MLITIIVLILFTYAAYRLQYVGQNTQSDIVIEPEPTKQLNRDKKGRFVQNTLWIVDKSIINRFSY